MTIFKNVKIITEKEIVSGEVAVENGKITAVQPQIDTPQSAQIIDGEIGRAHV